MLVVLLIIWALGTLVFFIDPKKTFIRWASVTAFVGSGGFLATVIEETLLPFLWQHQLVLPGTEQLLYRISTGSSFLCQVGLPYAFLMFAVHSGELFRAKTKTFLSCLTLLPPLLMLLVTPIYPVLQLNYWLLAAWVFPYFFAASWILLTLYRREKEPHLRKSRFYTNILIIVPLLLMFILLYAMRIQHNYEAWRYNAIVVGIQFVFILLISVKYGFLGVRFRIERRRLDSTLRAITSGTQILNHTIKNEAGKLSLYAERIHSYARKTNQPDLQKDALILAESSRQILEMMNRIQGQLQDIVLREQWIDPGSLIEQVADHLQPDAAAHQVEIKAALQANPLLNCDPIQLREILTNLCRNALEAMPSGGTLSLKATLLKRHYLVTVSDTGTGIDKDNLRHVFDPFFSTKKGGNNFGLGLSYCYSAMQKHQGKLEIYSVLNEGTTVSLYFPRKRVLLPKEELNKEVNA